MGYGKLLPGVMYLEVKRMLVSAGPPVFLLQKFSGIVIRDGMCDSGPRAWDGMCEGALGTRAIGMARKFAVKKSAGDFCATFSKKVAKESLYWRKSVSEMFTFKTDCR